MEDGGRAARDWFAEGRMVAQPPSTPEPPTMIDAEFARGFAEEWVEAWNSHDVERILAHCADTFELSSPYVIEMAGEPSGTLAGRERVAAYWRGCLQRAPELRMELVNVLVGVESVVVYSRSAKGRMVAEALTFDDDGRVVRAAGHYSR